MVSNNTTYKDLNPAEELDQKTLNEIAWRSVMLQASFNYERMQAAGWLWTILPGLKKIHTDKEDLSASMTHNLEFFNTHPFLVTIVAGIVLSLEKRKTDINTIRSVRIAAMGPLGGIGDALIWFTLVPIVAGVTADMAINGSLLGPILFFLVLFSFQMIIRTWLMKWSYTLGTKAISDLTHNAKEFTHAASILGVFVVGALTCNYGATSFGMLIPNGESIIDVQALFDSVLPSLLPLLLTLMCYFLAKYKGWKQKKIITLLLIVGLLGCAFGIWQGDAGPIVDSDGDGIYDSSLIHGYESLFDVPWHN